MNSFPSGTRLYGLIAAAFLSALVAGAQSVPSGRVEISDAAQPQLAVGDAGTVWLVFGRAFPLPASAVHGAAHAAGGHGGPRPDGEILIARSDDAGTSFGPPIRVGTVPHLMLGMRRGPRVAVHENRLTVTVISHELLAFTSEDGGRSWSDPVTINDVPTSAREGLHDLAASRDGRLFVTWLDLRSGSMELWGAASDDGGRTWSSDERIHRSPDRSICECCHPSASYDDEGNLAVMWRNSVDGRRDMWMAVRPRGASRFEAGRKLGEGSWILNACPMDGGRIVAYGDGRFGAVWQRAGEVFISGMTGPERRLGQGRQPVALHRDGQMLVLWQLGTDLLALRGLEAREPVKLASEARFPSVAALPGAGGAVLAYERILPGGGTSVVVERL